MKIFCSPAPENIENGAEIIWFGVSERGFQVKDDIAWMDGGFYS